MKGSELIVECLKKEGVKHIFGYPGGSIMPVYDVFIDEKSFSHILVRHEQGAAHAADAYARVLGKPGVCFSTSGPGATNLVTGIANAFYDSSPVVAFSGQVPTKLLGNDAFQEADMMGLTIPITKASYQIKAPQEIPKTIATAFYIAGTGRPGPVFVDLPKDVQVNDVNAKPAERVELPGYRPRSKPHYIQVKRAAQTMLDATYPVIIAGGGVIISGASDELMELVELAKIPVVTTLMGKGAVPENYQFCLGMLGMHGRKVANYVVSQADVLIAIGCRFSDRITGNLQTFAKDAKVIHIDIDAAEVGKNVDVDIPIVADAKQTLRDMIAIIKKELKKQPKGEWAKTIRKLKKSCECDLNRDDVPIAPERVMKELNDVLKDKDIVCTEVGQNQMFAAHFIERRLPRTFVSSGGLGTMGFGFPAAIGAKVAKPRSEVFDIAGDGSFQMVCQELATCKQSNIKVIPAIMNNGYLGMVRQWQEIFLERRYASVDLGEIPDFTKMAEAYSLGGLKVVRPSELKEGLQLALKSEETFVLDIIVQRESNILPMLPPGGSLDQFFGGCMDNKALLELYPPVR